MTYYLVSVYQNKEETLILIPNKKKIGINFEVNKVNTLDPPHSPDEVGRLLKDSLEFASSLSSDYSEIVYKEVIKGYRSYRKFTQEWMLVNAVWKPESEYLFRPQKRQNSGGYSGTGEVVTLPLDASNVLLGETLLATFEKCK